MTRTAKGKVEVKFKEWEPGDFFGTSVITRMKLWIPGSIFRNMPAYSERGVNVSLLWDSEQEMTLEVSVD